MIALFLYKFYLYEISHSFITPIKNLEVNLKLHPYHKGMSPFILMINRNRRRMFIINLNHQVRWYNFLLDISINNILSFLKGNDDTRLLPFL